MENKINLLSMITTNKCNNCDKIIESGDKVTVVVKEVEASGRITVPDSIHLKLSEKSLGTRALKVYCDDCLNLNHYVSKG